MTKRHKHYNSKTQETQQLRALSSGCMLLCLLLTLLPTHIAGRRITHRRLIIHVPIKMKTHHHTHTVFKHIHTGGGIKQTVYKILGYSTHAGGGIGAKGAVGSGVHGGGGGATVGHMKGGVMPHGLGGFHGHGSEHIGGVAMGHGEISYENMHDCESGQVSTHGHGARDLVFNHFSRHDDDYHDDEDDDDEFIDVDQRDWI